MKLPFDCISDFIFAENKIEPADILLIPGSYHPELMDDAARLFHEGFAPWILPSGGKTRGPALPSEWEVLCRRGVELNIPKERILREDQAKHTFDNARLSWDILSANKIPVKKAILVCKAFHARRALLTYQARFPSNVRFIVQPVADSSGILKSNWFQSDLGIQTVMGEVVKIGRYFTEEISPLYAGAMHGSLQSPYI